MNLTNETEEEENEVFILFYFILFNFIYLIFIKS